jgi:GTP 3',8-cyclase
MALIDGFGREITYLRMSVTDRCDFRCVYCMAEEMEFLPRAQVLTLEEMTEIGTAFVELGIEKIRLTGGEPLIRRNMESMVASIGSLPGLKELTITTNGSQLQKKAQKLSDAGIKRINVSLDSLEEDKFKRLTRTGDLNTVLKGIEAAKSAGFERIKLNAVILRGRNDNEVVDLLDYALENGLDISFIEEMPLGQINEHDRGLSFCSSAELRELIAEKYELLPSSEETSGPSRYWRIPGFESRVGFISPHSENFCDSCNRIRLTVEGRLLLCLGNEHSVDLRAVLRRYPGERERLKQAIVDAMTVKPERHYFDFDEEPQILRFMNATGG